MSSYHDLNNDAVKKFVLAFLLLFCLVHGQSNAQRPGHVNWTLFTDPSPSFDTLHSVKVQTDGKIVAAGNSYNGNYRTIAVGRYDNGLPDSTFGINGMATTSLDSADVAAYAMEIQPDGKIVVAGGYEKGTIGDFILTRYNQDGSTDSSFGIGGIVRTDIGSGSLDMATALTIQSNGRIVAAGRTDSFLAVCRFNTDGSPDTSFDVDGKLIVAVRGATSMMQQADGKIVICCGDAVIRLFPDGALDYNFGTNGAASLTGYFYDIAIQSDGKILVAGSNSLFSNAQFYIERLDTAGVPDNSFGNGGIVQTGGINKPNPDHGQVATSICVQSDGRILATGYVRVGILSNYSNFAVARYNSDGELDTSFGSRGFGNDGTEMIQGGEMLRATSYSAAINNNGELILAGTNNHDRQLPSKWVLVSCYLGPSLEVHTVPGVMGQIIVAPNPAADFVRIQSTQLANGNWNLSLNDLSGRTVYNETFIVTNNALDKSIPLTNLPVAVYQVQLNNGISRMTEKLIKSR
ncbi:MAG: T9SS type A sorting domain-containing protein [Bacteroidetes bacterium]|nr:T9SS type A sorting domain-containing protein [Bacteroidota bacterium]